MASEKPAEKTADARASQQNATTPLAIDPVCHMRVDPANAKFRDSYEGVDYVFCSQGCKTRFAANPSAYVKRALGQHEPRHPPQGMAKDAPPHHHAHTSLLSKGAPSVPAGTKWTCPMHPEIVRDAPGSCPICGMALEPMIATAGSGPNPELVDMTRRFWVGVALTVPVLVLGMGAELLGLAKLIPPTTNAWVQLVLATPVVLWAGWPFFERAWSSLLNRSLNMFTLIAMGTGVAWVYSVVATVAPELFPAAFRGMKGEVAVYFEAAAAITVLVLLGQVLELRAREATGGAIRALLDLSPKVARRIRADGSDEEIDLGHIAVGDRLRVRPGDKVPVDGVIEEGRSTLDESLVTGESMPVTKGSGAKVIGGTINQTGSFVMVAERVGHDTMLARIVQMVAEAQRSRAPIQRLADLVSAWFVPAVIAIALLAFAAWSIWGPSRDSLTGSSRP